MPSSPRIPLLGALAAFVGLVVTGLLALALPQAHQPDSATLQGFRALDRPQLTPLLDHVAHLASPRQYAVFGLALIIVALVRRRPRSAVAIFVLLIATGWTTHTLKPLLASPRYDDWLGTGQILPASWPSGHATASMTLALCFVIASPARFRPTAAALGALFAIGVSFSVLALGWHFPSDVLGGFFVATTWTLLVVAVLVALEQRWPTAARNEVAPVASDAVVPAVVGFGVLAAVVGVILARPDETQRFAAEHSTFVVGAGAIAALAVALVLALARGLSNGPRLAR